MVDFISVHVPKAAGGTFLQILRKMFGEENVILENFFPYPYAIPEDNIKVIHGHFPVYKYMRRHPDAKYLTWLRNPVDRVLSHYYFFKRSKFKGVAIADSIRSGLVSIEEFASLYPNQQIIYCPLEYLEMFDFIGITENSERCYEWFFNEYNNGEIIEELPYNKNPDKEVVSKYDISDKLRNYIADLNYLDFELYERAKELSEKLMS